MTEKDTDLCPARYRLEWISGNTGPYTADQTYLAGMHYQSINLQATLQTALDDLTSSRSSVEIKTRAISALEHLLALACVPTLNSDLNTFLLLQDTFECNIPCRLLAWISTSTLKLEHLATKGATDEGLEDEALIFAGQISQSLSLIQGVSLNHKSSKEFLGRRYSLEIMLDLLLASRHLSSLPSVTDSRNPDVLQDLEKDSPTKSSPTFSSAIPLTSVVLDTLLCVLVDSSNALRVFEESSGPQAVVKILKRAGTPREVRMKCLEFLYFYLLDETTVSTLPHSVPGTPASEYPSQPPTQPTTPVRPQSKSQIFPPLRKSQHSISQSISNTSFSSSGSFMSTPSGFSNGSDVSSSTTATSARSASSPTEMEAPKPLVIGSPPRRAGSGHFPPGNRNGNANTGALLMLKREVDYEPLSPKKAVIGSGRRGPGVNTPVRVRTPANSTGNVNGNGLSRPSSSQTRSASGGHPVEEHEREEGLLRVGSPQIVGKSQMRTTEEKKEILGSMLGNVDALVEGVRKAGIWGLR